MFQSSASWYVFLVGAVFFTVPILVGGGIMALLGKPCESFQQPAPKGEVHFIRPFVERAPKALFSLAFFGVTLVSLSVFSSLITGVNEQTLAVVLLIAFSLGASAWSLRLSGPEELRINLATQSYRRVTGWPLYPTSCSGPCQQILGVYMRKIGATSSNQSYYLVGFLWNGKKEVSVVGSYNAKEDAEAEAERLQAILAMKRVAAPK